MTCLPSRVQSADRTYCEVKDFEHSGIQVQAILEDAGGYVWETY